jgi:hypothetical protein
MFGWTIAENNIEIYEVKYTISSWGDSPLIAQLYGHGKGEEEDVPPATWS